MTSRLQRTWTQTSDWYWRHAAVLELGFGVALFCAAFLVRVWPLSKVHFWDEAVYLQNAEVICCGKTNYSELESRPPLLSLIFAMVFRVWHSVYAADIVTAMLNAAGPALLYVCGRRIVGRAGAAIAALLMAFVPFFVGVFPAGFDSDTTGNSLLTDSPALTILLIGLWILLWALRRESSVRFSVAGFVLGLAVLMRFASLSSAGVLMLLVFAATRWWKAAVACGMGFVAAIVPYLCWSRVRYGGFFETFRRGWRYYEGARESPLFLAWNFGVIFSWITLAGLVLWVGRWAWERRGAAAENGDTTQRKLQAFLWLWAAALAVFFMAVRHQEPRYAMPIGLPLFLLAGSGLSVVLIFRRPAVKIASTALLALALGYTFLPLRQIFEAPLVERGDTEEMQVAEFLDRSLPAGTVLYSNFNYPLFGYYTHLPVYELPEAGPNLYDALETLPGDGILIAYKKKEIAPDPRPEWLDAHPEFQAWREFPSIVLYRYHKAVTP
jgi:Dolichyl-phosphate-mannose-protein mannosyltransferase